MIEKNSPLLFSTAFDWLGGEPRVRLLTERFYDLMDLEPKFSSLRSVHGSDLSNSRERLYLFLMGWLGGPALYIEQYGHPRLRQRHMGFQIGVTERNQWVACMAQAMLDLEVPLALYQKLLVSFYNTADWMRNQPDSTEGAPQMPVASGIHSPRAHKQLQKIMAQYELPPLGNEHE